jgi:hypothetical protein
MLLGYGFALSVRRMAAAHRDSVARLQHGRENPPQLSPEPQIPEGP